MRAKNIRGRYDSVVPSLLVIAPFDPSGQTGIVRDLREAERAGVEGTGVVTAILTPEAPGGAGSPAVHDLPPAAVAAQLRQGLASRPDAVRIGLLPTVPIGRLVAVALAPRGLPVVLAPGLTGPSGGRLVRQTAIAVLVRDVLPRTTLVVVDLFEASALAGQAIRGETDAKAAARRLQDLGAGAVLVFAGPAPDGTREAGLLDGRTWFRLRIGTEGTSIAAVPARVAARLAMGEALPDAVEAAFRADSR